MLRRFSVCVALALSLTGGCDSSNNSKVLSCNDDPTGRPKHDQEQIRDACALDHNNTPSNDKKW
ncbi:hypothetical protein D3C85_998430 [compost metagenome]